MPAAIPKLRTDQKTPAEVVAAPRAAQSEQRLGIVSKQMALSFRAKKLT